MVLLVVEATLLEYTFQLNYHTKHSHHFEVKRLQMTLCDIAGEPNLAKCLSNAAFVCKFITLCYVLSVLYSESAKGNVQEGI